MEGRIGFRDRKSNFSLNFLAIEPSNSGETRSKVALRGKGYLWTPILWGFNNFGRLGSSPTWFISGLRALLMVLMVEAVSGHLVSPKTWD